MKPEEKHLSFSIERNENSLPQVQKITDQKKMPAQDTSRGAREN